MNESENPVSISADRKSRQLTVIWADKHKSLIPFGLLRKACPCASCRGGHEFMSSEPDPAIFDREEYPEGPDNRMANIQGVGSYALGIEWEDGHNAGIYNWHYLRALCPCDICRAGK